MIGVLAANRDPSRFGCAGARRSVAALRQRRRLPRRLRARRHRGAAGCAGCELSRLVGGHRPDDHGQSGSAGTGRAADRRASAAPTRISRATSRTSRSSPTTERPRRGHRADAGAAVHGRRDRTASRSASTCTRSIPDSTFARALRPPGTSRSSRVPMRSSPRFAPTSHDRRRTTRSCIARLPAG